MIARRCLGYDGVVACGEPATLECLYGFGTAHRHYRCEKHPPPATWFPVVRLLVPVQLTLPRIAA